MKTHLTICFILCLLALSSCETMFDRIFEKEANYDYLIHNNATATIYVEAEAKTNVGVVVVGALPGDNYAIEPGSTRKVWSTSGLTGDWVRDEEKGNPELYWFRIVSAAKGAEAAKVYLNDPKRWAYRKEKNYEATYTLTLTENDF